MDDKRRMDDVIAARTEQKLDDFIIETKEWRIKFEDRLKPLEDLNNKLKTPIQVVAWLIGGPVALWLAHKLIQIMDELWKHVQPR